HIGVFEKLTPCEFCLELVLAHKMIIHAFDLGGTTRARGVGDQKVKRSSARLHPFQRGVFADAARSRNNDEQRRRRAQVPAWFAHVPFAPFAVGGGAPKRITWVACGMPIVELVVSTTHAAFARIIP